MDFSLPQLGTLSPTLLAHQIHGAPFCYGSKVPYPSSIADLDLATINGRVEARITNYGVFSYSVSTLAAMFTSASGLVRRVEQQLVAGGLLDKTILSDNTRFTLRSSVAQDYELNGVSPFGLEKLFRIAGVNPTLQPCHLAILNRGFEARIKGRRVILNARGLIPIATTSTNADCVGWRCPYRRRGRRLVEAQGKPEAGAVARILHLWQTPKNRAFHAYHSPRSPDLPWRRHQSRQGHQGYMPSSQPRPRLYPRWNHPHCAPRGPC